MVRELSKHPQVLADVLSLSAASDEARLAAASEEPFDGPGSIPCIEALRAQAACPVPVEDYEASLVEGKGGDRFVLGSRCRCWWCHPLFSVPWVVSPTCCSVRENIYV